MRPLLEADYPFPSKTGQDMALLNIQDPPRSDAPFSLFVLGFRPFFLAAGLFAVASIGIWMAVYEFGFSLSFAELAPFQWHAHEMIYGYTLAVVAGFLLTAIRNWTGIQTWQGARLKILLLLWLAARVTLLFGDALLPLAAAFDLLFNLLLVAATTEPVLKVRQWKQVGILAKVVLIGLFNAFFYLGLLGVLDQGVDWSLYGGLLLLIALVLAMGRRVIPFFIERGVGYPLQLANPRWLDVSILVLFLAFSIVEVFILEPAISGWLATALFALSLIRLYNWHTPGIWGKPLLWGLYMALVFISFGFLVFALLPHSTLFTRSIGFHAFAFGGIGLITLSMMSRVTLGHTGRDIQSPSPLIGLAQWLVLAGALVRLLPTAFWPQHYSLWIALAQLLWIFGFTVFVWVNAPLLRRPRVDGAPG